MVQGIGKEYIFPADEFKGYYLSSVAKYKEFFNVQLLAFCVMGNHAHLLVKIKNIEKLPLFMSSVNSDYAKYYNRIKKRVGYVFRGRYKSEVVKNIKHLLNCIAYIQNNPVKAKLVKEAKDYTYSSYINYLTGNGIIDFKEAKKYYDITPRNIVTIMNNHIFMKWIEHDDNDYEDAAIILEELLKRYKIIDKKYLLDNNDLLFEIVRETKERSGLSLRKLAVMLDVNREKLRRVMSMRSSP